MNDTWGPPELVALDIDGTIMNFGQPISERVHTAIRKTVASGAHVVLATGRSVISARPVVAELGLTGHVVCSDGAIRIDAVSGELIAVHTFDAAPLVARLRVLLPEAVFAAEQRPGEQTLVTGEFPGFDPGLIQQLCDHSDQAMGVFTGPCQIGLLLFHERPGDPTE